MSKTWIIILAVLMLTITTVSALTWKVIDANTDELKFKDKKVNVSSVVYDDKKNEISIVVDSNNQGLSIQEISEIQSFAKDKQDKKDTKIKNKYDKTVIIQN